MKHIKKHLILLFLISQSLFSQTKIDYADFSSNVGIDDHDKVGKEIYFIKKDSSKFNPGKYLVEVTQDNTEMTMFFEINEQGSPFGIIEGKYHKYKYKYTLKGSIVEKFDLYDTNSNQLVVEEFAKNDSIVSNFYLKNNQKITEKIKYKGKIIYENNCRYDNNGLKLYMCSIIDETKGEEIGYNAERITYKKAWKNLPKGISKIVEIYHEDGISIKETTYVNGDVTKKTTNPNGTYEIETVSEKGRSRKEYSKNGKLIKTHSADYKKSSQ